MTPGKRCQKPHPATVSRVSRSGVIVVKKPYVRPGRRGALTRAALFVVAVLAAAACAGGERTGGRTSFEVRDSAGVTILENGRPDLERTRLASPDPVVTIGVVDGAEEYQLFQVADVKRLSDGAIAVANGGSRELRIYEADGTHRATAGGPGEGPSEFRYPRALVILPGDTIQVQDFMDRALFAPDGSFVRRESVDGQTLLRVWERAGGQSEGGVWTPAGRLFAPIYHWDRTPGPPRPGPLRRPDMTLVLVSTDFATIDTIGDYGGILQQYVDVGGPRGVTSIVPPHYTNTMWSTADADGTVVIGDNAAPEVHRFHADGRRSIVRWEAEPQPVTSSDVEAWKERQRNASWTRGQLPELERGWAAMDVPEQKAYYGRSFAGSDGQIWVELGDFEDPTVLMSFDADGRYLGTVEIPGIFTVHDSGPDWLAGVLRGADDIEYVQVYAIR